MSASCKDHKGKRFKSVKEMCEVYGVSRSIFFHKIRSGASIEEALTGDKNGYDPIKYIEHKDNKDNKGNNDGNYTDHLGNKFTHIQDMCEYWGINYKAYHRRRVDGWSIEKALTTKIKERSIRIKCIDHIGNHFETMKDMCEYWGINYMAYRNRIQSGWSIEQALTTKVGEPVNAGDGFNDHTGQHFVSIPEMCRHWNIDSTTYRRRLHAGWTMEKALTTKISERGYKKRKQGNEFIDHIGNHFNSIKDMCRYWGITYTTYHKRIQSGWDIKDVLTMKSEALDNRRKGVECIDHIGNHFKSIKDMRRYWGITYTTYHKRIKSGLSIERVLTKIPSTRGTSHESECIDHIGNHFKSIKDMCKFYGINYYTYRRRLNSGWSIEKALTKELQ